MDILQLTAEVFIDTGKDFRPEDSLTVGYSCVLGETVTLDFDLSAFENTVGFRFDPLLEDSSMIRLESIVLRYDTGEEKSIEGKRIKTNSDVDLEPIYVYLHCDPKFFVDEALCTHLVGAGVRFQVLELGIGQKEYWTDIKKANVPQREKEQILGKLEAAMEENRRLSAENRRLRLENEDIYASGIWKLRHDGAGPLRVLFGKGNLLSFLAAVYAALCVELFAFNNAYYAAPRPNQEQLVFQPLRFGLLFLGAFVLILLIRSWVMKGYRHETA